jgi:type IV secretion system protein VirB10
MAQSLQLGASGDDAQQGMRRLNRLPIVIAIAVTLLFFAVVVLGLSWRGLSFNRSTELAAAAGTPATSFGDQLKRGVSNGIIGEPEKQDIFKPTPIVDQNKTDDEPIVGRRPIEQRPRPETKEDWKTRLKLEQDEQYLREVQRQRMARLQASAAAHDSPLKVDFAYIDGDTDASKPSTTRASAETGGASGNLYETALNAGLQRQNVDQNGQISKEDFLNQDIKDLGYLPNQIVPALSLFELKRGSVIPATLITGLNSDLPGRITAQVSQNVYDSATGHRLLIPQGAKLFGRYDSKIAFGQGRVLVVWTDLIFPNGSTLQIGGMAGTDAEGYGGFKDKVDRHLLRTFGSAALIALIGTGIDMSVPESSKLTRQDNASDAARRNFAETFGRVAEQTISKNLNVQPTIQIRPGYKFNLLVDQDIIFPSAYRG